MKKQYIAPQVTVVSFKMEHGYVLSGTPTGYSSTTSLDFFTLTSEEDYNSQAQENWSEYDNGNGSSSLFGSW